MNPFTKAKLALLKRTAPKPIYWLASQIVRDAEETEANLRRRISELEREMWFWKDKYQDEFLSGKESK